MIFTPFRRGGSWLTVSLNYCIRTATSIDTKMKVFTQKRNPVTGSQEWELQHEDYDYHQEIARSAFADMLHDTERNKKYHLALQQAINKMHHAGKKANVLDIGTGTGLLSIMAARCGADSIVACEAFKPMAECCAKILEQNGVADKITLIPKRSTEITVGENGDMKQKANILVTEVFDTELIGEGALSTFSHAHKYLLEPDSIVVPDSAVVYAQVVECPLLKKWNGLNDLTNEDGDVILKVPEQMKKCPGVAAVHDLQLSQMPRHQFIEVSDQIPVFFYDWSGRSPLAKKKTVKQTFMATCNEEAQVVFMWWELNMDTEGKILLSCAPWWCHPDANTSCKQPQKSIPWRDHWMQAVYYLPKSIQLTEGEEYTLICCQDEYSLWFYLEDEYTKFESYQRPICGCGLHVTFSRTHLAYLNDVKRSSKFISELQVALDEVDHPVVLDLNGSSLMGLAATQMGAEKVYILETNNFIISFLLEYIKENNIKNVELIKDGKTELLNQVTTIICDPNFSCSIMPWDNLKMAYLLNNYRTNFRSDVTIIPSICEFWAMPVEFQDLQKIRIPLGSCEGINMTAFDDLVESSRAISDSEIEVQPLWEYPCKCRGVPRKLLEIDLRQLKPTYANNETFQLTDTETEDLSINGFTIWTVWYVGNKGMSGGPTEYPEVGHPAFFDRYTKQGVKLLKQTQVKKCSDKWSYQVTCDLKKGQFDLNLDFVPAVEVDKSDN